MSRASGSKPMLLGGLRVLLAEDSWLIADGLRLMLEAEGAKVVGIAATLDDAGRLANQLDYDVAVMDLDLRGVSAGPLMETLADSGRKVVVITAHDVAPSLAAKVKACIGKPFTPEMLVEALRPLVAPG